MKKIIMTLIVLLCVCGAQAQQFADALYVYRNDGGFNAFTFNEIDSITFSPIDIDGVERSEAVVQEFHTREGVVRIPIAAIDSVSFVQPEVRISKDVVRADQNGLFDYLVDAILDEESMILSFAPSLPLMMRPQVGDKLVYLNSDKEELHYEPFVGKVRQVATIDTDYGTFFGVDCDSITDLAELFDQLIGVQMVDIGDGTATRASGSGEYYKDYSVGLNFEQGHFSVQGNASGSVGVKVEYNIAPLWGKKYVRASLTGSARFGIGFTAKAEKSMVIKPEEPVYSIPGIPGPPTLPVFQYGLEFRPYIKTEGSVELNLNYSSDLVTMACGIIYDNGTLKPEAPHFVSDPSDEPDSEAGLSGRLALKGAVSGGLLMTMRLGTIKQLGIFSAGINMGVGPKLSADLGLDFATSPYEAMKGTNLDFTLCNMFVELFARTRDWGSGIWNPTYSEHTFFNAEMGFMSSSRYIVPEFTTPTYTREGKKLTVSTTPSRKIFGSAEVGFAVYDSKERLIDRQYHRFKYFDKSDMTKDGYTVELEVPVDVNSFTIYPCFKLLGQDIDATPSLTVNDEAPVKCPDGSHPHMVDLGLPSGTLWACSNMGASSPSSAGAEYPWGLTSPTLPEGWMFNGEEYYAWVDDEGYVTQLPIPLSLTDIAGTEFDAAAAVWGNGWQMPNEKQAQELADHCQWSIITANDMKMAVATGPNGNKVLFPLNKVDNDEFGLYGKPFSYCEIYLSNNSGAQYTRRASTLTIEEGTFAVEYFPVNVFIGSQLLQHNGSKSLIRPVHGN